MKYFKTFEKYRYGVNGVGSLRNSLAALKRQNINGRYVDPEILAQGIRNEYEAITGEKYEDEVQMSMDNTIADIIGHFKLDGPEFMAAWDKVVKESVNEAKLKRGDKITIEFDDEDGDYKAGEYTVIGGSKGGKELEGMGIKIFMTDRELNSIEYTVKESVNEAKGGQIFPGDYVKTQYGDVYLRVDGKVGGSDAYVRVIKGKAGKRKTGLHDSMKLTLVNKDGLEESVNDAYNNLEKIFGTDQETMDIFQSIEDKGTVKDMIEFIDEFGNEEMLSRYGIRSTAQVKKLAKTIMNESYKGNFTDFKYDLEMAIDNMGISPKAIKAVKKKGKGYEVRLSSYMSDKSTWEKIGDTIGATLISFKPGSINIGIYE